MNYAHTQGVLHRDLKPSNVLLEPRPAGTTANGAENSPLPFTPRITDFGLAKINDMAGDHTRIGSMLGTPAYMAPEQAEGRTDAIDNRTDVYGLGAILYELRGAPSFAGTSEADTVQRVLTDDVSFPRSQARCAPADLEAICLNCLEKKPSSRERHGARWRTSATVLLAGEPTHARPAGPAERILKWSRRRPAVAALVVVSILAAVTIVGGSAIFSRRLADALKASEQSRLAAVAAKTDSDNHRHYAEISRNEMLRERDANAEFLYAARMHQAFQLLPHGALNQVTNLLAAYEEGTPYAGLRNFEWHYLKRSLHGERLTLTGHKGEVYRVTFSPDGRILASAAEDGVIKLRDPASGQELRSIAWHSNCEMTCRSRGTGVFWRGRVAIKR